MSLYLDASVLVPTIVVEQATDAVEKFLLAGADNLIVSDFATAEVASALSRLVRMGRLTDVEAIEGLADFDDWRAGETDVAEMDAHDFRLANTLCPPLRSQILCPRCAPCCDLSAACVETRDTRSQACHGSAKTRDRRCRPN